MRSIWAVAVNTIKQALRMKIALVFIILLLILLPAMGATMTGDGTLKGRLQSFISYGLSLTSFLLCLLTIAVSIYSLTSDLEQRQIYTVLTKPLRRWQLLLGKLLGVILLDVALLVLFSGIIYAITIYMPKFSRATEDELAQVNNEFFTARAGLTPAEVDVTAEARDIYEKLEKSGQLPQDVIEDKNTRKDYIDSLTRRLKLSKRAAAVGGELVWEFNNVKPLDPNQSLFVRFKYDVSVNPPDLQVYGGWFIGDYRQVRYGTGIKTPFYTFDRKDLIRTFCEIEVPADAVAEDGYLAVGFLNVPLNNTVVIFPPETGLEVLYKADTFTANFIRAVLLILCRLIFFACLGIMASSFLSFPVAILLCLAVFFTGTISNFVIESFDSLSEDLSSIYSYTFKPIIHLLPQFDRFNPAKFLVPGRLLSWPFIAEAVGLMVCVKAFLLLVVGLLIFSHREIAKVIV
jgi:ABC-type multidrug transport system fused ATPase/permease subunit